MGTIRSELRTGKEDKNGRVENPVVAKKNNLSLYFRICANRHFDHVPMHPVEAYATIYPGFFL